MGMYDNFTAETGPGEGERALTILSVEFGNSKNKGTAFTKLNISSGGDHKMFKTYYEGKMFNRFMSSFVSDIGLKPKDLEEAARNGYGEEWIRDNFTGRRITIWCGYGEPNADGKKYLEPMSTAEREFKAWVESQNNSPRAPSPSIPAYNDPPIDSYQGMAKDDQESIPF